MHLNSLFVRFRRFHAPLGMLLVLLQRTPVLRLVLPGAEFALSSTTGQLLKCAFGLVAMGAYNSVAGATTFTVISAAGTATGGASSTFQIAGTVGTPINGANGVTMSISGAPGTPKSFGVTDNNNTKSYTATLPPGVDVNPVTGTTAGGAPYYNTNLKLSLKGTPTTAGTYTVRLWASDSTAIAGGNSAYVIANFTITGGVSNVAPSFTTQPTSVTVSAGSAASFTVGASGTPTPTYQWQKGGVNIAGATNATYSISSTVTGDAGSYAAVATNSVGSVTSSAATLTVNAAAVAPSISSQPQAVTVTAGAGASFSVTASGTAPLSYQWQKGGAAISGATNLTYSIASTVTGDAGSYTVVVSNSVGSVTSAAATLTVNAAAVAPSISSQPQSATVTVGSAANFSVTASGTAPLGYQWQKAGAAIAGATNSTYSIASAQTGDAGSYTVTVSNVAGSVNSAAATLTVNIPVVAPSISSQPQAVTVTAGAGASFSVTASGTAPLGYQWQKGGAAISGATNSIYSITSTVTGDAGSYTVVVSNSAGSVTSAAAALTVNPAPVAPSITTQPQSATVTVGSAANFSVAASGTAPLAYQWNKGGAAIAGAISATYSIASAQAGDAGNYTVTVSNAAGSVNSATATLTVNPALVAPTITSQPQSLTVTPETGASFATTATGTAPLSYQWQKGGAAIAGATGATYSLASAQAADAGNYTVVVTNSVGSATSTVATLTVNAVVVAPSITTQPQSLTVTAGAAASFAVTANGTAPLTYQWRKGGTNVAGATSATYSIASAQAGDAGSYTVVVTNSAGTVTSTAATLTVNPAPTAPSITTQPQGQTVTAGAAANFSVAAGGTAPLSYQWKKSGTNISGATSATYSIASAQAGDAGNYTVMVSNGAGSVTSSVATLTVSAAVVAPTIATQPQAATVTTGSAASFSVTANGTAPLSYQWQKGGAAIVGATNATYSIASAQAGDAGNYTVMVSNSAGSVTSAAAALTINAAASGPTIATQPQTLTVTAGASASFSVTANGTAPLSYQWRLDGTAMVGATNSSYSIASAQSANAGNYTVVVSNATGSVTSGIATLTVNPAAPASTAPVFTSQPINQTVATGHSVSLQAAASGSPTPSYLWQVSTNSGSSWTNLSDGSPYSGSTTSTLTVNNATAAMNGYSYRLTASNSAGSATSNAMTLTVATPPIPGPNGLAVHASGNLYISDSSNNTIQLVSTAGVATVLAGSSGQQGSSDGYGVGLPCSGNLVASCSTGRGIFIWRIRVIH